jgi:hypothetical protein
LPPASATLVRSKSHVDRNRLTSDAPYKGLLRSEAAGEDLKGCYEAARKTGKEERCTIAVKPLAH